MPFRLRISRLAWMVALFCTSPILLLACQPAAPKPHNPPAIMAKTDMPAPTRVNNLAPSTTPTHSGPQTYTDPDLAFRVSIPQGWQSNAKNSFKGENGVLVIQQVQENGGNLSQACILEANKNPSVYGETPQIQMGANGNLVGCLIQTSLNNDRTGRTGLLLQFPPSFSQKGFLLLRVDPVHFQEIAASFIFITASQPSPTPENLPTLDLNPPLARITPTASTFLNLTLEEYPVVAANEDTPSHFEFNHRIPAWVFEKNQAMRNPHVSVGIQENNARLTSQGYRLELQKSNQAGPPNINLFRGDQRVEENIHSAWPVSINQGGTDFAMLVDKQEGQFLIQKDKVAPWDMLLHSFTRPVFVGDDLIILERPGQADRILVKKGDHIIYGLSVGQGVENPVKGLYSYDQHWILEVSGLLVIDGEIHNEKSGYQEIFGWSLLDGKPFYFFRKDGKIGMSYQGQVLPVQFEDVIHDRCCESAAFNPGSSPNLVWFYALKNGIWEYAEMKPGL